MNDTTQAPGKFPEEWMTVPQAAMYAHGGRDRLEQAIHRGEVRAYAPWGTQRLVSRSEIDEYIRSKCVNEGPRTEGVK